MNLFLLPYLNALGVAVVCTVPVILGVLMAAITVLRDRSTMLVALLVLSLAVLCFTLLPHTVVEVPYGLWFS